MLIPIETYKTCNFTRRWVGTTCPPLGAIDNKSSSQISQPMKLLLKLVKTARKTFSDEPLQVLQGSLIKKIFIHKNVNICL